MYKEQKQTVQQMIMEEKYKQDEKMTKEIKESKDRDKTIWKHISILKEESKMTRKSDNNKRRWWKYHKFSKGS